VALPATRKARVEPAGERHEDHATDLWASLGRPGSTGSPHRPPIDNRSTPRRLLRHARDSLLVAGGRQLGAGNARGGSHELLAASRTSHDERRRGRASRCLEAVALRALIGLVVPAKAASGRWTEDLECCVAGDQERHDDVVIAAEPEASRSISRSESRPAVMMRSYVCRGAFRVLEEAGAEPAQV
jgi:hypothetical protein